jgi:DNA-3-methyladenine glycosylase II
MAASRGGACRLDWYHAPLRNANMSPELHNWFLDQAAPVSARLAHDLAAVGPVWFPDREDHGTAAFLARAVIGQQISAAAARGIWGRIEAGASARGIAVREFLFAVDAATLRACGLSGNKVKAILGINEAAEAGELAEIHGIAHAVRSDRLCRIWGIGQWTCDMLAIFYCRETDVWPEGDLAVLRTFRSYIGRRKPAKAAAQFAPYRSVLALYMWRITSAQWK